MENYSNKFIENGDLNQKGVPCYTALWLETKIKVERATINHHCKQAVRKYYADGNGGFDFSKPPHPDYVEVSAKTSKWLGVTNAAYIIPLSEHNLNFYSEENQKKRLSSRGRKAKVGAKRRNKRVRIENESSEIRIETRGRKKKVA